MLKKSSSASFLNSAFSLKGKIALVTGATGRLGPTITESLAAAGANLIIIGRNNQSMKQLSSEIANKHGVKVDTYNCDLSCADSVVKTSHTINANYQFLDIFVNNAFVGNTNTIDNCTLDNFDQSYRLGLSSPAELIRNWIPLFRKAVEINGDASIINVSSMYGLVSPDPRVYGSSGQNSPPDYSAMKAALIHYTSYMAVHLAPQKIRVNAISPGPFPDIKIKNTNRAFYDELVAKVPLGRIGRPHDLIGPIIFLASNSASFVTGSNIIIDGGWTKW